MIPRYYVKIDRVLPGSYVKGRWVEGNHTTLYGNFSIQPADGRVTELLPEGRRTSDIFILYGDTYLQAANEKTLTNADRVLIFGEWYEVFKTSIWKNNVISHFVAVVLKVESVVV